MSNSSFLVIGSNSFSGAHFVAGALAAGYRVWGVSRSAEPDPVFLPYRWPQPATGEPLAGAHNFEFQAIDLNHQLDNLLELVDRVQPTHVVNFAAQGMVAESWLNPTHWYRTNVVSQVALHDALRQRPFLQKYVHVTTPEVYGSTDGGWIKEHNQFAPSTPYAVSRAACDLHLLSFHKAYGFPVLFTRAANVYGPGQQLYRIIPRTLLSVRSGKPLQLHGGGHSVRAFIHISDVVAATLQLALEAEPGECYHLSSLEALSIRELVQQICIKAGVDFEAIVQEGDERLGKDQSYVLDSSKVRERFGWQDQISLDAGLDETLGWVENNIDQLRQLPWHYIHKS